MTESQLEERGEGGCAHWGSRRSCFPSCRLNAAGSRLPSVSHRNSPVMCRASVLVQVALDQRCGLDLEPWDFLQQVSPRRHGQVSSPSAPSSSKASNWVHLPGCGYACFLCLDVRGRRAEAHRLAEEPQTDTQRRPGPGQSFLGN